MSASRRVPFLNLAFDDVSFDDVVEEVAARVASREPGYMASVNLDILVRCDRDPAAREAFLGADLLLMDSQPLMRVAARAGTPPREKLSGSDLMPRVCAEAARRGWSVLFVGGAPGVPERAAGNLASANPGLRVAGAISPEYGFERDGERLEGVVSQVRASGADVMFLCLGAPKSELLLRGHLREMGVPFSFCVGAAVDFAAGSARRAPAWVQRAGLEWLWRFSREPRRLFRRYFVDSWHYLSIARRYGKGGRS